MAGRNKNVAVGCAGICLKHKAQSTSWTEDNHCFCKRCDIHMVVDGNWCPCCGRRVRRRKREGRPDASRIGSRMAKVLLVCGHSHNTFQLRIVDEWEAARKLESAILFYCADCKDRAQIVWAWLVTI